MNSEVGSPSLACWNQIQKGTKKKKMNHRTQYRMRDEKNRNEEKINEKLTLGGIVGLPGVLHLKISKEKKWRLWDLKPWRWRRWTENDERKRRNENWRREGVPWLAANEKVKPQWRFMICLGREDDGGVRVCSYRGGSVEIKP